MPSKDINNILSVKKRIPNLTERRRSTSRDISNRPIPVAKDVVLNENLEYRFTMDFEGNINYANSDFCNLLGYEEFEIMDESSDMLTHPDVPNVFFEWYLESLLTEAPIKLVTKLISKKGYAVWVFLNYIKKFDADTKTMSYSVIGKKISTYSIQKMATLFKILRGIEKKTGGVEASRYYLIGLFEDLNLTYDEYINNLIIIKEDNRVLSAKQESEENQNKTTHQKNNPSYNSDMDVFN